MTELEIVNNTSDSIIVYITLGATPGCVQDVSDLTFSTEVTKFRKIADLMCCFVLEGTCEVSVAAPDGLGFNGNVSFNTPPMNCKSQELPFGMNLAEFIINNGFQEGYPQETVDISCVTGANAEIMMVLKAADWTTNGGQISVNLFKNGMWDRNTDVVGVFPYGCDNCTASVAPPECVGLQPQNASAFPICNVQRDAQNNQGGSVVIVFLGIYQIF